MANYSTFVYPDYIVDSFPILSSLPASQFANAQLLQQLKALTNPTSDQIAQINSLTITLQNYLVSTDQWNAFSQAVSNMESLILKIVGFKDMGAYSSVTNYSLWNSVTYNGQTFISKQDTNTGNTPVGGSSDLWWSLAARKGDKGDTGAKGDTGYGVGLSPKGIYDSSAQYHINDLVNYLGNLYYAIQDNLGHYPSDSNYWTLFLSGYGENLANLNTNDKSGLVNAINEVLADTHTNANEITVLNGDVGNLTTLNTTNKTSLVSAINEVNLKSFNPLVSPFI